MTHTRNYEIALLASNFGQNLKEKRFNDEITRDSHITIKKECNSNQEILNHSAISANCRFSFLFL